MNNQTIIKDVHVSPKKLRFLMDFVKKLRPVDAVDHLAYMSQHSARVLKSAIQAAISSSVSALKTVPDMLKFRVLTIDQGHVLKRFRAGGRGTAKPIKRRLAHIKIILEIDKNMNNKKVPLRSRSEARISNNEKMTVNKTKPVLAVENQTKKSIKLKKEVVKKPKKVINKKS